MIWDERLTPKRKLRSTKSRRRTSELSWWPESYPAAWLSGIGHGWRSRHVPDMLTAQAVVAAVRRLFIGEHGLWQMALWALDVNLTEACWGVAHGGTLMNRARVWLLKIAHLECGESAVWSENWKVRTKVGRIWPPSRLL